jgi:reductive dehalogenase
MQEIETSSDLPFFPIEVPSYRFDQRNEMFKRRTWDEEFFDQSSQFYTQVKYRDRYGYRKLDYALRNASWNIEYAHGFGILTSNQGLYSWTHVPDKVKRFIETDGPVTQSPETSTQVIKKAARFLGADLVGICYAHPNLIYSHEMDLMNKEHRRLELPEDCTHAVVMAVEMDYEASLYSPDGISGASTGLGYSYQAIVANLVAAFIRGLGYRAIPSGNDTALSIPMAIAAGLGELGRNGLLITEKYGPRVRICKVFTNLPLLHDDYKPFGVTRFCETCKKCADRCPSKAISHEDPTTEGPTISNHSGARKWYVNPERCFSFWAKNWMDCNNCVSVCPFNKPAGLVHEMVRFSIRNFPIMNSFMLYMDGLFGYGKPMKGKDFWESN